MENMLTIFTPTFNRAYILNQLFDSLKNQSSKDFQWLVIDDGSIDNTKELIEKYKEEADFKITYLYKENGGKHTAINKMLDMIETEMVMIVDSDDFLSINAVETIMKDYSNLENKEDLCAMIYYRMHHNGEIIGDVFEASKTLNYARKVINKGLTGDRAEVVFTDKLKKYRFPEEKGEKFMGETVVWIPLFRRYNVALFDKPIYYCEYIEDGLSFAGRKLRIKNPKGGMINSLVYINNDFNFKIRLKNTILYIIYSFFANQKIEESYKEAPQKGMFFMSILPAWIIYLYWNKKYN